MQSQRGDTTENSSAEVGGLGLWAVGLLELSLALSENEDRQVKLTPLCSRERQLKFTPPSGLFYDSTAPQADWKSIERERKKRVVSDYAMSCTIPHIMPMHPGQVGCSSQDQ